MRSMLWGFLVVCFVVPQAMAAPVVTIENCALQPNDSTPQAVTVAVSGLPSNITGEDLYFQVGDGTAGPEISGANIVSGTPFSTGALSTVWMGDINSASSGVWPSREVWLSQGYSSAGVYANPASTTLATVYVTTTGLFAGSGPWTLYGNVGSDNPIDFTTPAGPIYAPANITVNNGTLTIAPEPSTLALLAAAIGVLPVLVIRNRMRAAK